LRLDSGISAGSLTAAEDSGKPLHRPPDRLDFLTVMNFGFRDSTRACRRPWALRQVFIVLPVAAAGAFWAGCASEEPAPRAVVKPVTAYGLTLDENATPKQVAFVLLRSIADDVQAAQARETNRQKEALRLTYSLAAYSTIARRIGESQEQPTEPARSRVRDKRLYVSVKDWASIVAHYVASFDTDYAAAARKMHVRTQTTGTVHLLFDACHNPAETDPARQETATIEIELTREPAGPLSYWRVAKVSFAPLATRTRPAARSAPASAPQG